jgi:hypothetical protein
MPVFSLLWKMAARLPALLDGRALHRMGLAALHGGCCREADALFERAAGRYRADLAVEPLARLRAHQGIARFRAGRRADPGGALEIERQLYRLRTIESLEPPHALIDSSRLLASWNSSPAHGATRPPATLWPVPVRAPRPRHISEA